MQRPLLQKGTEGAICAMRMSFVMENVKNNKIMVMFRI